MGQFMLVWKFSCTKNSGSSLVQKDSMEVVFNTYTLIRYILLCKDLSRPFSEMVDNIDPVPTVAFDV
jgi:hypothetical protein